MKKILSTLLFSLLLWGGISSAQVLYPSNAPSYDKDFASHLTDTKSDIYVRNPWDGLSDKKVSSKNSLKENVRIILSPGVTNGGFMANVIQVGAIGLLIIYLVYAGIQLLISGKNPDELKKAATNLWYIALGALFIYGAGRLFGDVLDVTRLRGIEGVSDALSSGNNSLLFQVLSLLKSWAFFFAIIMIVVTGFRVINAADADKSKKIVRGVINVLVALVIIKVVDFIYYIAGTPNFAAQATDFILSVAKFFGYVYGAAAVLMVFYAGYSLLTDGGGGSGMKRAKNLLINLVISGVVLFSFLLILYQVFAEFA